MGRPDTGGAGLRLLWTARLLISGLIASPSPGGADPAMECGLDRGSQVEVAECLAGTEEIVDRSVELALGFAMNAARELDVVTGRAVAVPALEAGQAAWEAWRQAHCDFVGATYGGGSGTGIAVRSCRVELGRARVSALMEHAG